MSTPATPPKVSPPKPKSHGKHVLTVWGTIICLCLVGLIGTYMLFVEAPPPKKLVMATGGTTGAYYQFGEKYAEALKKEGLTLEVRVTKGSVENLQLLRDDESGVQVAIVQSGVATPEDREHLQALGSLYREPLWVFYRPRESKDGMDDFGPITRLSQLRGRRIGVGPQGSGTYPIAMKLLAVNGVVDAEFKSLGNTTLVEDSSDDAKLKLQEGKLDAAFFVAALEAKYIKDLLNDSRVNLLNFSQREAYHRKFRFLSEVTIPAGLVNLGQNIPKKDVALVAPTAMLVSRNDLHPALVSLLLTTAIRMHGKGDELSNPGEFPSASYTDIPISEDAKHFYKSGPPVLQRLLPFWLASLVDRLKVMLIPLIMLLMPLLRAAPPLVRWRTRRKIYLWYSVLREIDPMIVQGMTPQQIDAQLARLRDIEHQVAYVEVPLSYMEEFYHLRLHLAMVHENLEKLKAQQGTS
jgi:TRAP transporter TAXI family solute receptor